MDFIFYCDRCETWHGRFEPDCWNPNGREDFLFDRLVEWRESLPDFLIIIDNCGRCLVVETDSIF